MFLFNSESNNVVASTNFVGDNKLESTGQLIEFNLDCTEQSTLMMDPVNFNNNSLLVGAGDFSATATITPLVTSSDSHDKGKLNAKTSFYINHMNNIYFFQHTEISLL